MNEATQSLVGSPEAAGQSPEAALPPEETLRRFTAVLEQGGSETEFQQAMVEFSRAQTGGKAAVLIEAGPEGQPTTLVTSTVPNFSSGFSAAPEVRELASSALGAGGSLQAGLSIDGMTHILLGVVFHPDKEGTPQLLLVLLGPGRAPFVGPIFSILHLLTRAFVERGQIEELSQFESGFEQSTLLIDLFSRASQAPTLADSVSIVAREVSEFIGCSRVAIGIGQGTRLKVEGISGFAKVEGRSHGTRLIASAMREAMGLQKVIAWPVVEEAETQVWPATDQQELLEAFAAERVLIVPLETSEGRSVGAWMFLFKADAPLDLGKFDLIEAATPHAAALLELVRGSKPTGIRGAVHRFWATATRFKRAAILTLLAVVTVVLLVPVPHRVSAPCEVQPRTPQQVAAPFDGILDEVFVQPGKRVDANELLAVLDGKELGWRHAEALAEREMALKKRDLARSNRNDQAEVQMAQLEADAASVRVDLLAYQKNNLEIRAPIDGYILSGDLEKSEGVPVTMGKSLFDIAPLDTMYLEIAVSDGDINWVEPGMDLTMRLEARPRDKYEATIKEVYPISETKDSKNVFICLAEIENVEGDLRPGMGGKVKIQSGFRPFGWVLFHKPWEFIQLHL